MPKSSINSVLAEAATKRLTPSEAVDAVKKRFGKVKVSNEHLRKAYRDKVAVNMAYHCWVCSGTLVASTVQIEDDGNITGDCQSCFKIGVSASENDDTPQIRKLNGLNN